MSDGAMWIHDHDELDDCVRALEAVHAFLHHELAESDADQIRMHLHACEQCMENFDIESTITAMIQRSNPPPTVPKGLAARITMRYHQS